jgi:hypothetical protein
MTKNDLRARHGVFRGCLGIPLTSCPKADSGAFWSILGAFSRLACFHLRPWACGRACAGAGGRAQAGAHGTFLPLWSNLNPKKQKTDLLKVSISVFQILQFRRVGRVSTFSLTDFNAGTHQILSLGLGVEKGSTDRLTHFSHFRKIPLNGSLRLSMESKFSLLRSVCQDYI